MTSDGRKRIDGWINAHHDGLLKPDQQAKFDRAAQSDAELRAELDLQKRIDASLKRQFAPPPADAMLARALAAQTDSPTDAGPAQKGWSNLLVATAVAAGLLIAATLGVVYWLGSQVQSGAPIAREDAPPLHGSLAEVFAQEVENGFKPSWVCRNDMQFALTTYSRFGQGMLLKELPRGTEALGWSYSDCITRKTAHLLARVGGKHAIVFVDESTHDGGQSLPPDSPLNLFKRQVDKLVLYEVTEAKAPALLDAFYVKEIPDEWKKRGPYSRPDQR